MHAYVRAHVQFAPAMQFSCLRWVLIPTHSWLVWQVSMLHGDVKPENVIVVLDGQGQVEHARLIDFGLAFKSRGLMQRNMYIQSRWYRSPEVLLGIPATTQIDVWSLACVVVEMFAGEPPFRGQASYEQMLLIMDATGLPTQRLRDNCEQSTLKKVAEMEETVKCRWLLHLGLTVGSCR